MLEYASSRFTLSWKMATSAAAIIDKMPSPIKASPIPASRKTGVPPKTV